MKQLKILPTIGPASEKETSLKKILEFTDIIRTNGSHNSIAWHENISKLIKKIKPEALHLLDIPGVKPRTGNLETISINKDEIICFYFKSNHDSNLLYRNIRLTKPLPPINPNNKHFSLADGQFTFTILDYGSNFILGKSISQFELHPHKGLNIPGAVYDDKLQLKHYKRFLGKCKNINYDVIGLSYIQSMDIIKNIKHLYKDKVLVSKIENREGLKNVKAIVDASDVIMIDRGDLAAEVGSHNLFDAVLKITSETKKKGKPLIMATENLVSMFKKNEPTKSEIMSLGLNTIIDGDIIMLSEETAVSSNWLNTIKWLNNYLKKTKKTKVNSNYNYLESSDNKNKSRTTQLSKYKSEPSIWSSFKFNSSDNFVFISRTGASIKEFKKKYISNESLVFTDSLLTKNLCKFWKDVTPIYLHSISGFNDGRNIIKIMKRYKSQIFNGNRSKAVFLFILNPRKDSRANCIYIMDKKDLD